MTTILTDAPERAAAPRADSAVRRFREVRQASLRLAAPLSPEDCQAQSMVEASPVKWHLAHTTWFFETFILQPHLDSYRSFHPDFSFLFNSYYNQVGKRIARPTRGLMTRPAMDDVMAYRRSIDDAMEKVFADEQLASQLADTIETGLQHEQQHQELLLTDVKHLLSMNPLQPAYRDDAAAPVAGAPGPLGWIPINAGVYDIGYDGDGFCFDNEGPRHRAFIEPVAIADRLVTNREYRQFMDDGGYERPELWLDQGWSIVQQRRWSAPLYWCDNDPHGWRVFTLGGGRELDPDEPATHVSFFEADAYARWAGARLVTEEEWEVASQGCTIDGNFVEHDRLHPQADRDGSPRETQRPRQMFGDAWEWTGSQYRPYPGYRPPAGAIGEYNGKFMSNQFVLRGGSCATPRSHVRRTYRNFFPPESRWQFTGIRLAKDIE